MIPVIEPSPEIVAVSRSLKRVARGLNDWRPLWHEILPKMIEGVQSHFISGGSTTGGQWPPTKKPGKATMVLTGALIHSMSSKGTALRFLTRSAVGIGSPIRGYPYMQHFGAKKAGKGGKGGYPAHPYLVWSQPAANFADKASARFVERQLAKVSTTLAGID